MSKTFVLVLFGFVALFYHLSSWRLGRESEPIAVTSESWNQTVHGCLKPVVAYFHQDDDEVVTSVAPKIAKRLQDIGRVVTVDLQENSHLAIRYAIQEVPVAKIISKGVVVQTLDATDLRNESLVARRVARFAE